jgi:predicted DNA-binding transcriptional regulator YafY
MRGTQLARQWKILRLFEARKMGIPAEDLSSDLDTPVRSVYRDLETVQEAFSLALIIPRLAAFR